MLGLLLLILLLLNQHLLMILRLHLKPVVDVALSSLLIIILLIVVLMLTRDLTLALIRSFSILVVLFSIVFFEIFSFSLHFLFISFLVDSIYLHLRSRHCLLRREVRSRCIQSVIILGRHQQFPLLIGQMIIRVHASFPENGHIAL